jgi:phage shock protein A
MTSPLDLIANLERVQKLEELLAEAYADADEVLRPRVAQLEARVEELRSALEDCHKARSVLRDAMAVTPVKWDEARIDIIGPNGNDGLHYQEK